MHDQVARIWVALLTAAGFKDVTYEDRRWDAAAGSDEAKHRRPDIVAFNPVTQQRWVIDVSLAWAPAAEGAKASLAARNRERYKVSSYREGMGRRVREAEAGGAQVPEGWVEDVFVPLGYEVEGAWGASATWAFEEVVGVKAATVCADLTDWSKINFGEHWKRAIAVALANGQAAVISRSAKPDELAAARDSTELSQESNPDSGH